MGDSFMKDTRTLEEQIAAMTEEQKEKVIKVGKTALIIQLVGGIPLFLLSLMSIWTMISPPIGFDMLEYDRLFIGTITIIIVTMVYFVAAPLVVKLVCPDYSDKKWNYIQKERKAKK